MPQKDGLEKRYDDVRGLLDRMRGQLVAALPRHMTPDRFLRVVLTTVRKTPKLLECEQASFLGAIMACAQLGLEPDGVMGYAYLVPYGKECTLVIGYKGMADLARRSGKVEDVDMRVVRQGDEFEYEYGTNPRIRHVPGDEDGPLTHAYSIVWLTNGRPHFVVLRRSEIDRVKGRSRAGDSGPWKTDYEAMAMKTAVKRACKLAPASVELQRAIALDDRAEVGKDQHLVDQLQPAARMIAEGKTTSKDGLDALTPPKARVESFGPEDDDDEPWPDDVESKGGAKSAPAPTPAAQAPKPAPKAKPAPEPPQEAEEPADEPESESENMDAEPDSEPTTAAEGPKDAKAEVAKAAAKAKEPAKPKEAPAPAAAPEPAIAMADLMALAKTKSISIATMQRWIADDKSLSLTRADGIAKLFERLKGE